MSDEAPFSLLTTAQLHALRQSRLLPRSIPTPVELEAQLLGTEFCASLSASMAALARGATSSIPRPAASGFHRRTPSEVLLHDLSAHFGSHALRRAGRCPFGPCYASRPRRLSSGHHDGRRQLWSLSAAHHLWCRRCGLFLVTGETKVMPPKSHMRCAALEPADTHVRHTALDLSPHTELSEVHKETTTRAVTTAAATVAPTAPPRGTYVCRRCFDEAWDERVRRVGETNSELDRTRGRSATREKPFTRLKHADHGNREEGEEEMHTKEENVETSATRVGTDVDTEGFWRECMAVAVQASCVGRSCRRKRTRHGDSADSAKPSLLTTSEVKGAAAAAAQIVPKGSLARGRKRPRAIPQFATASTVSVKSKVETSLPVASVQVQEESVRERGRRNQQRGEIQSGKESQSPAGMIGAPLQVPVGPRKPPPKGGPGAGKGNSTSGGTSQSKKGSFADTMARLGL